MTRLDLLRLVVGRARVNGFEFRRWYTARLGIPWISADASVRLLDTHGRYYALLFSHEFAIAFWKPGTEITFEMPAQSFERRMPDGSLRKIQRKPFVRRSVRRDVWRYHLRQMSLAEEPLRYLRRYLHFQEALDAEPLPDTSVRKLKATGGPEPNSTVIPAKTGARRNNSPRPLPKDLPAFLKRPYGNAPQQET